jgi:hypothetical protein
MKNISTQRRKERRGFMIFQEGHLKQIGSH